MRLPGSKRTRPSGGNVVYTAIAHLVNAIQDVESQFVILRQQVQGD